MTSSQLLRLPIQWLFAATAHLCYIIPGKLLSPIMVAIGIWTGWRLTLTWAWCSTNNSDTGSYYDRWYSYAKAGNHSRLSRWAWEKGGFWREWYWRVRNGFSNGARYAFTNPVKRYSYVENGLVRIEGKNYYLEYHRRKWWFARFRWNSPRFGYYIGWKFSRSDGFGLTHRIRLF